MNTDDAVLVVSQPLNFDSGISKIEQQGNLEASAAQVIDALSNMHVVKRLRGLQFDNQPILHDKIREVLSYDNAIIHDRGWLLLLSNKPVFCDLVSQRVFVNLLKKPYAESI